MTPGGTRLFFFSHVLSPTGLGAAGAKLCAEARRRGTVTVVDGVMPRRWSRSTCGRVRADFYTGNCHKWMLAPDRGRVPGRRPGNEDRLEPLHVSWGYRPNNTRSATRIPAGGTRTPGRVRLDARGPRFLEFEGTRDVCPWLAVPEAIDFQADIGVERIRGRIAEWPPTPASGSGSWA